MADLDRQNEQVLTGYCLCGSCSFELVGRPNWVGHCHCESCRRATSSPFTTWIGHPNGSWSWTGAEPKRFESSLGCIRGFCGNCGSPMFFSSSKFPGETHFYASLLSDPTRAYPTRHYHLERGGEGIFAIFCRTREQAHCNLDVTVDFVGVP